MKKTGTIALVAVLCGGMVLVGMPLILFMVVMGSSTESNPACGQGGTVVLASGSLGSSLSERQAANASTIISEGNRLGMPERAILVALTVASQESRFLNYANDGKGEDLAPEQRDVGDSLALPHQAVGSDHGSLGVFQQQWPWWGTMAELMDPATAARKFYARLEQTPGWSEMSIGEAAQAVQRSAYPGAYDDDVDLAVELLGSATGFSPSWGASYFGGQTIPAACGPGSYSGTVVHPLADPGTYVDSFSFGATGAMWESTHTGTDFATACGTPVLAATDGRVAVRTDQPWSGPWLVQVDSGQVETWYAHMQAIKVSNGQDVRAGDVIGRVGSEGNSSGCHLHFEVRPGGGSPVDPSEWLELNVGQSLGGTLPAFDDNEQELSDTAVLISANIPFWLSDRRVNQRIGELLAKNPDVLLLQEMGRRDVARMVSRIPGSWGTWQPQGAKARSVIVWDTNEFAVTRKGAAFGVDVGPYEVWLPWMLLESESGTLPVVNIHMPTNSSQDPQMERHFRATTTRYQRLIREFSRAGYPPIVGGDWNHPLDVPREWWSPVPMLRKVAMTTNWQHGRPCQGTSANNGRIDGFAYNPDYLQVVKQGCLDRGPSDHRPIWVEVAPAG